MKHCEMSNGEKPSDDNATCLLIIARFNDLYFFNILEEKWTQMVSRFFN